MTVGIVGIVSKERELEMNVSIPQSVGNMTEEDAHTKRT